MPVSSPVVRRAFTLIELLIVVAIIAILAAIAVPNFLEAQTRSKISRVRTDLRTVATALESYRVDWNKLPQEMSGIWPVPYARSDSSTTGWGTTRDTAFEVLPPSLSSPVSYMSSLPDDTYKVGATMQAGRPGINAGASGGRTFRSPNSLDTTFVYHNIAGREAAVSSGAAAGFGYTPADLADYGSWRVFSIGPMRSWWSIGTGSPSMDWKYDATNGTISPGYIIRTEKDATGENFSRGQ